MNFRNVGILGIGGQTALRRSGQSCKRGNAVRGAGVTGGNCGKGNRRRLPGARAGSLPAYLLLTGPTSACARAGCGARRGAFRAELRGRVMALPAKARVASLQSSTRRRSLLPTVSRARDRSLFGLYQVISQGLEALRCKALPRCRTRSLGACVPTSAGSCLSPSAEGKRLWSSDTAVRTLIQHVRAGRTDSAALEQRLGRQKAIAVTAYLRANPSALTSDTPGSLQLARDRLRESFAAAASGDRAAANELALSAYLDGFEPVEAVLATRDSGLMTRIEAAWPVSHRGDKGEASQTAVEIDDHRPAR